MTGLQTNIGLFSGINYVELVDQLIKIDGISKTNLENRNVALDAQYNALFSMNMKFTLVTSFISNLNRMTPFLRTDVFSSNSSLLSVSKSGNPVAGNYTFTTLQMAASQQTVASGVASSTDALGKTGTITIGKGWTVDNSIELKDLNGGQGVSKGSFRITDGSGTRVTIDIRKASTINDVVNMINDNDGIDVIAELDGDRIILKDVSGGDLNKFTISEVSGGSTAASLGLMVGQGASFDNTTGVLTGKMIWHLGENMSLDILNDGNGVVFDSLLDELYINCKDGSKVLVNFNKNIIGTGGESRNTKELTVGDLLNTINTQSNGKITAKISDNGKGITLTDNTQGSYITSVDQNSLISPDFLRMLGLSDTNFNPAAPKIDMFTDYYNGAPAKMTVTDGYGQTVDVELTKTDIALIRTVGNNVSAIASRLTDKFSKAGLAIEVQQNNTGSGFIIVDKSDPNNGGGGPISFSDFTNPTNSTENSDLATRLGLANMSRADLLSSLDGVKMPETIRFTDKDGNWVDIEVTQADLDAAMSSNDNDITLNALIDMFNDKLTDASALTAGAVFAVEPGKITFTDSDGDSVEINITQSELDALTSQNDIASLLNSKIGASVGIVFAVNSRGSLVLNDTAGGTELTKVESDLTTTQSSLALFLGIEGSFDTSQVVGRAIRPMEFDPGAAVGIHAELNATGDGLLIVDTTGGPADTFGVNRQGVAAGDVINSLTYRLGINLNSASDEIEGRSFGSLYNADTVQNGTITTRNLIGGLDTVLVSTLNGGSGLSKAKPGAIEVQDRAGNKATLTFSQAELNSMNSLTDTMKLFNAKLADAGVGITVRLDDLKTTLEIVDTTGKGSHNLIFRDLATSTTIPGTPGTSAVPAIDAVDAVSGDNGTGGTAFLKFEGTHWMNDFTFSFTDVLGSEGYDSTPGNQKFTFYLDRTAIEAELDPEEQDRMVLEAINTQLASMWDAHLKPTFGVDAPEAKLTSGFAASVGSFAVAALDDASTGGETAIKSTATGAVMGVTYVPEVPAVPATPDIVTPGSANIASSFGLNINSSNSRASGTSLNRQSISHNTSLSELNGGQGIIMTNGSIVIKDSAGKTQSLMINESQLKTVGDLLEYLNLRMTSVSVTAKINETGDGITFEDFAGGTGTFSIYDANSTSKFAESLGIAQAVSQSEKDADGRMRINVSETHRIEVEESDSLEDIKKKINNLNLGYSASILNDGSNAPYRLSLTSKQTGAAGAFNIDLSAIGLTTETMNEAKDAKIMYGDGSASNGLVLTSSTNTFSGVIENMTFTITGVSDTPVTISSASSSLDVKTNLKLFVERYNEFREQLTKDLHFETSEANGVQGNVLWNCPTARAFDREVTAIMNKVISGIPGVRTLADLGITMSSNIGSDGGYQDLGSTQGKLYFDEDKFQEVWDKDKEAVQKFFFDEKEVYDHKTGTTKTISTGWVQSFMDMSDILIGSRDGLVVGKAQSRMDTLQLNMTRNDERIAFMEERLEFKRQMYLKSFYNMEQALAKMTSDSSSVANIMSSWSSNYSSGG